MATQVLSDITFDSISLILSSSEFMDFDWIILIHRYDVNHSTVALKVPASCRFSLMFSLC